MSLKLTTQLSDTPYIDQHYWQCTYNQDLSTELILVDRFHVNSLLSDKIDYIRDWHVVLPERLIIGDLSTIVAGKSIIHVIDGKFVLHDSTN